MNHSHYFELIVFNVPKSHEDVVTNLLFEYGCLGVSEKLDFTQDDEKYLPTTIEKEHKDMVAYFDEEVSSELVDKLEELLNLKTQISKKQNKDWNKDFKKSIEPFELVDDIWLVPTWYEGKNSFKDKITIDPGMAFGTGTHHTTQVAAELIKQSLEQDKAESLLDVGTGSGILSLLAALKGVGDIEATEIDADAREVAKENAKLNKLNINVLDNQVEDITRSYDLVVANIIDGVLLEIRDHLYRSCKANGSLILTGVLKERESSFEDKMEFSKGGFKLVNKLHKGEWLGYLLKKES